MALHNINEDFNEAEQVALFATYHAAIEEYGATDARTIRHRNKIAEFNCRLVHKPAQQMADKTGEIKEDFEQVGMIGLIRAVERFEPKRGNRFASYAMSFIRGEMLHHVRDNPISTKMHVKRSDRELYYRIAKQHQKALEINPDADIDTIALSMRDANNKTVITEPNWLNLRLAIEGVQAGELNEEITAAAPIEEVRRALIDGTMPTRTRQCLIAVVVKQSEELPLRERIAIAANALGLTEAEVEKRTKIGLDMIRSAYKTAPL